MVNLTQPLDQAVTHGLRALADANSELATLRRQMDRVMTQRQAVIAGLTAMIRGLPQARAAQVREQVLHLTPAMTTRKGVAARTLTAAILDRLATWPGDMVRPRDLTLALEQAGVECHRKFVSNLLSDLHRSAVVTRQGKGLYRINQDHPDLVTARQSRLLPQAEPEPATAASTPVPTPASPPAPTPEKPAIDPRLAEVNRMLEEHQREFAKGKDMKEIRRLADSTYEEFLERREDFARRLAAKRAELEARIAARRSPPTEDA